MLNFDLHYLLLRYCLNNKDLYTKNLYIDFLMSGLYPNMYHKYHPWYQMNYKHHKFLVLMADVAFDPPVVDEVGYDAGHLIVIHVLHLHQLQSCSE